MHGDRCLCLQRQSQLVYLTSTHDVLLQPQGLLWQLACQVRLFWPDGGSPKHALVNTLELYAQVNCSAGVLCVHPVWSPLQNVQSFFIDAGSCWTSLQVDHSFSTMYLSRTPDDEETRQQVWSNKQKLDPLRRGLLVVVGE